MALSCRVYKRSVSSRLVSKPCSHSKKNKEWRMCVDYTDLNRHCPKDPFGLPRIDEVVDSLKEEDQIKTSFIMPFGACYYTTMSFELKNTRVTYQRAIQMCLNQ